MVEEIDGVVNDAVPEPPARTEPPDAAAYQSMVSPTPGVAEIMTVPVKQRLPLPAVGRAGMELIVIPAVAVTTGHPPEAAMVYVTVYVPAVEVDGVIVPVELEIVNPEGETEYVPPEVPTNATACVPALVQ